MPSAKKPEAIEKSPIEQALDLVAQGTTIYAAAKMLGIRQSSLYSAANRKKLRELEGRQACPCCGTNVPRDRINAAVLVASAKKAIG
jgi:Zn finger protein HypA/HybF involved in hydrogenase expression